MSLQTADVLATLQSCPGMTAKELAQVFGLPHDQLSSRLYRLRVQGYVEKDGGFWRLTEGDTVYSAKRRGVCRPRAEVTFEGETRTIQELSEIVGIPYKTLYARVHILGWPVEDAVSIPVGRRGERRRRQTT